MTLKFFVPGTPQGQPRAKATRRGGFVRMYTPGSSDGWRNEVSKWARSEWVTWNLHSDALEGPLKVSLTFHMKRPKSHFTKKGLRRDAPSWHASKPDRDNLEKLVLDAITKIGIWKDDNQVCCGEVQKIYTPIGAQDGCWISITDNIASP